MSHPPEKSHDEIVVGSADAQTASTDLEAKIAQMAQPAAASHGGWIEEVSLRDLPGQRTLTLLIDRLSPEQAPMSLDAIAEISREADAVLEESGIMGSAPYEFEVSTPGVSRPLTRRRHFDLNIGRWLIVKTLDGGRTEGRLISVDAEGISIQPNKPAKKGVAPKPAQIQQIPFSQMRKAKVDVEFAHSSDAQSTDTQTDTQEA